MLEYRLLEPGVEGAQQGYDAFRRLVLGAVREADDVGEQHGDRLDAHLVQRLVGLGQAVDDPGREIAGEVGPLARRDRLPQDQTPGAPRPGSENAADDQEHDHVLGDDVEVDEAGIQMHRKHLFGCQVVLARQRAGLGADKADACPPGQSAGDAGPGDQRRGVAQRHDRDEHEEIDEGAVAQHHLRRPHIAEQEVVTDHREAQQDHVERDQGVVQPGSIAGAQPVLGDGADRE